jgi:hypothetical protein
MFSSTALFLNRPFDSVADPVGFGPDPDPTSKKRPDPDPYRYPFKISLNFILKMNGVSPKWLTSDFVIKY